jgi:hypothetical protein
MHVQILNYFSVPFTLSLAFNDPPPRLLQVHGVHLLYRMEMNFETAYFNTGYSCPDLKMPMRIQKPKNPAMT